MIEKDEADAISRRCSLCAVDWPDDKTYKTCPECLDPEGTSRVRGVVPMDEDEARSKRLKAEFERFYEKWDAERDPARLLASAPPIEV